MVFLNPKRTEIEFHYSYSSHHFVVKIVQIPRSPIFEAMGHTSVFPIDENEVAEVVVLFSQQNHFIVRVVHLPRSLQKNDEGLYLRYSPLSEIVLRLCLALICA